MNTQGRGGKDNRTAQIARTEQRSFRLAPLAQAIALIVATGGLIGNVHAAPALGASWFAAKRATQETARTTGMVNGRPASSLNPQAQQQQANAQLQKSIANLGLAAHGIAAQQAAQAAARQAALDNMSPVPDGLGEGGLDTGSLVSSWINVNGPSQKIDANGKTVVDIQQTADKAIANWNTFNVGKNTIVQFAQQADWAILNRVMDPLARPSQIQGQIKAPGTVLIVNRNGIVFSGSSQVNVRNLIAAAADIDPNQFTANGIYGTQTNGVSAPSFTNASGKLIVEAGAQITTNSPGSVTQGGGYVLLMGQQVSNAGDIETRKGQIEMAAGDNFVIRKGVGTDANQSSTTRGNEISPQLNAGSAAGQVINTGLLLAREGDITLAGHDVQQNGVAVATTTVNTRGTIHLLNSASDATGLVTLGGNAITTIALEDDGASALDSQRAALIAASGAQDLVRPGVATGQFDNLSKQTDRQDQGRIEIVSGGDVRFEGNSLSLATGGQIAVSAANRTFAADGAILDVSGQVGVNLAMASNNVVVNVQGNELRDSPDNRDSGNLASNNITIDRRNLILVPAGIGGYASDRWYTAGGLLEVSGYLNNQNHGIGEWAAQGGTIQLGGKEVVTQTGSQINLSGGALNVATGYAAQTWLVGSDGKLYNADNAPAGMTFRGVYKGFEVAHPRWGKDSSEFFYNPLIAPQRRLENGYTVGRDAGQLIVNAPTAVIEGNIIAKVFAGAQQTRIRDAVDGYLQAQTAAAKAGTVSFGQYGAGGLNGANATEIQVGDIADITSGMAEDDALAGNRINTTWLDASRLTAQGLGELDLATLGGVKIAASLALADGGALAITAPRIDIDAGITAHGGSIVLGNLIRIPPLGTQGEQWIQLPASVGATANVNIGANSELDLRGVWTNMLTDPESLAGLPYQNGGTLTVSTTGGVALQAGSVVDVSSGGALLAGGKLQGGKGGSISLITNNYAHFSNAVWDAADRTTPLIVDGEIRAYGFNGGGTLTLSAPQAIVIGGNGPVTAGPVLNLDTALFQSGFTNYDITGSNGMQIADGTTLAPTVPVYRLDNATRAARSGSNIADAVDLWTPPMFIEDAVHGKLTQRTGADVTLVSTRGDFLLPQNAAITVDPGHAVDLYINGQTTIKGDITAKGGSIVVGSADERPGQWRLLNGNGGFSLTRSIWIGEDAVLDVSGQSYIATDAGGRNYGMVQDGGSIELGGANGAASNAFIVIRPGALLNASGASGLLDVATGTATSNRVQATGDGGMIALNSNNGIYIDGDLRAAAGGAGASGGTLSMNLVSLLYSPQPATSAVPDGIGVVPDAIRELHNITIVQNAEGSGLAGNLAPNASDAALQFGQAKIGVDQIRHGGFDALALKTSDLFVFKGDVNLSLGRSLTMAGGIYTVADATPNIDVRLTAPYIRLDGWTEQQAPARNYSPSLNNVKGVSLKINDSRFTVSADLVDLSGEIRFGVHGHQGSGSLSYTSDSINTPDLTTSDSTNISGGDIVDAAGFGQVNFNSRGDMRFGNGTVKAPGDLAITAAQIYPLSGQVSALFAGLVQQRNTSGGIQGGDVLDDAQPGTITIRGTGGVLPQQPASAFGNISFIASTIDQGGIIRAPLGIVSFNNRFDGAFINPPATSTVIFRSGSVTSASANGLTMPFGGTSDGVGYQGADGTLVDLGSTLEATNTGVKHVVTGISVAATSVISEAGSLLDLSGGGTLTGAGFVSGRGGSVDILKTPLINANPANTFSSAGNQVYAIMPGYASVYAPVIATNGAGDPANGRQVTIPAGVPGLPAGTYTLLPSSYALLPGAFRVEVGAAATSAMPPRALPGGSYFASGTMSVANTGIHDALPTQLILSSGKEVRSTSQYNEMSYADFARSQAALFGSVRPRLPDDGKILQFNFGASDGSTQTLSFAGIANFDPVNDGIGGSLLISSSAASRIIDITAPGVAPIVGHSAISSDDLNAFHAASLFIGGGYMYQINNGNGQGPRVFLGKINNDVNQTVNLLDGATLRAGQVFLVSDNINVAGGAIIDTRGQPTTGLNSSFGYVFANNSDGVNGGPAVLAVANGWLNFLPMVGTGKMNVASGASLLTEGSIVLGAPGALIMGDVNFGARFLTVAQDQINIGGVDALAAAQAAGVLPAGWNLNQATLDKLLHPSSTVGVPALERLTLTAGGAINLFGSIALDARSQSANDVEFVLSTPAIYGLGNGGDVASITADHFFWNGVRTGNGITGFGGVPYGSKAPVAILAGGAGTGTGSLTIQAGEITLGYDEDSRPTDGVTLDRLAVGFGNVNLIAGSRITGNSDGTLSVGQGRNASGVLTGGNLTLTTPLLTAEKGAAIAYSTGGALRIVGPSAGPADTAAVGNLGGTVSFSGDSVFVDTAVALPSGKLTLNGVNDVAIGGNARIDLAGRTLAFFDVNQYSWGGDLVLTSAHGDITQDAGSLIDVSATSSDAGSITATALDTAHGHVLLNGVLRGNAAIGYQGGSLDVAAQNLGDFAALNTRLNAGGFFGARAFTLKQGSLVVGDEVKAQAVTISVDGGSLTVNGAIDASGFGPGSIRLSARDDLTLASTAVLDMHSTLLHTDSYGAPIEAGNTSHAELTTSQGTIVLTPGAIIDMRAADDVARGKLEINAPRIGVGVGAGTSATGAGAPANATGNDVAISAAGPLDIRGAAGIAVNAFTTYANAAVNPSDANGQLIDQGWLDLIHQDSAAFIDAALVNTNLQTRLAGLKGHGAAFHLRPGVDIASATPDGNLGTSGDLDFSNYRYGPGADATNHTGLGEVGVFIVRAGGNLNINGSITDGFAPPPTTPDDFNFSSRPTSTGSIYAIAPMLTPGAMSWSLRLVSGADLAAADSRSLLTGSALGASGNMVLNDTHNVGMMFIPGASVIRTGTGYLELMAGGNYDQQSPYGIYTAGTAIAETGTSANAAYNIGRGMLPDGSGSILGFGNELYDATLNLQERMYYTEHGGDVLLTAQGNISGTLKSTDSVVIGNWLWRQGGAGLGQATAWGINFGSYVADLGMSAVSLNEFSGVGALGGGNVALTAGGDIGNAAGRGIVVAVGGSGRVMADGRLVQTGGGTLSVKAGGDIGSGGNQFVDLRGDINIAAGSFGSLTATNFGYNGPANGDPRQLSSLTPYAMTSVAGGSFAPGDGTVNIRARGDLAMGTIDDPGRVGLGQATYADGGEGVTWFTLWTGNTAVNMFGAGGNVAPLSKTQADGFANTSTAFLPPIMRATAGNGSIFLTPALSGFSLMLPSATGALQLLAGGSVIQQSDASSSFGPLSTSLASLATPFNPGWAIRETPDGFTWTIKTSNVWTDPNNLPDGSSVLAFAYDYDDFGYYGDPHGGLGGTPFVFGPNTVSDASAASRGAKSKIYAVDGDITGLRYGEEFSNTVVVGGSLIDFHYRRAVKPVDMMAGGDIVGLKGLILNDSPTDISTIAAGGDVIYAGLNAGPQAGLEIAGPGMLEISAGKNVYQGAIAGIDSIGPLVSGDTRPGASIVVQAGIGAGTPGEGTVDWSSFARRYLDPANLAGTGPLADQPGKVAKTYNGELMDWLKSRFGYVGSAEDAFAYFLALPAGQHRIFLRTVYYAELTAGGREFNDQNGPRTGSYLRGREAIAALFPLENGYDGDITLFSSASASTSIISSGYVHTDFGGDIQLLAPGGQVTVGSEGLAPGAAAGLITQGGGNIQIYSKDSLLLGLSRIMTTFGGNILAWSATGDINAGRGSKTTVLFTPPKRTYDDIGDVALAPQVPGSGAGIATLKPIPEVPAGDVDLIAPLGTIDAGEAGIRVSGNVNLAALQVVNAANIQVQGKSTGIPMVAAVNVGALTNASAAASQATVAAQDVVQRERAAARQALPSIFTVRVLGFGNEPADGNDKAPSSPPITQSSVTPTYDPSHLVQLVGLGGNFDSQQLTRLTDDEKRRLPRGR